MGNHWKYKNIGGNTKKKKIQENMQQHVKKHKIDRQSSEI